MQQVAAAGRQVVGEGGEGEGEGGGDGEGEGEGGGGRGRGRGCFAVVSRSPHCTRVLGFVRLCMSFW